MRRYWHFSWIKFVVWTSLFFHSTGKFEFFSRRSSTVINTINFKQYCKQFDKYFEWDQIITQNQFISERWNCWIFRCRFVRCLLRIYKTLDGSQLQKIWELFQGNGWPNEVEIVLRKNCGRRPLWLRYGTGTRAVRNLLNHYFILFYFICICILNSAVHSFILDTSDPEMKKLFTGQEWGEITRETELETTNLPESILNLIQEMNKVTDLLWFYITKSK